MASSSLNVYKSSQDQEDSKLENETFRSDIRDIDVDEPSHILYEINDKIYLIPIGVLNSLFFFLNHQIFIL